MPTLRRLAAAHRPVVFSPVGAGKLIRRAGLGEVHELDWGQAQSWMGMRIHCVRAQHFSARTPFDRNHTLWCGWVVQAEGGNLYYAGDTGFGSVFAEVREQFPAIRLALLPIGAYEPEWFMGPVHMTPEQAVDARETLQAAVAVGIHFGTFALADDGETAPVERLRKALEGRYDAEAFWVLAEGEGRTVEE